MATTPEQQEPGFEHDVNELPDDDGSPSEESVEDDADDDLEDAQEDAANEREDEGGYQ